MQRKSGSFNKAADLNGPKNKTNVGIKRLISMDIRVTNLLKVMQEERDEFSM